MREYKVKQNKLEMKHLTRAEIRNYKFYLFGEEIEYLDYYMRAVIPLINRVKELAT